jgi:hypothetical protein
LTTGDPVSLAQRYTEGPPRHRKPCHVRVVLEQLSPEDGEALRGMLADPKWSDAKTFAALKAEGVTLSVETDQFIGDHRRHQCGCP